MPALSAIAPYDAAARFSRGCRLKRQRKLSSTTRRLKIRHAIIDSFDTLLIRHFEERDAMRRFQISLAPLMLMPTPQQPPFSAAH